MAHQAQRIWEDKLAVAISELQLQALQALPSHTAVLDNHGKIIAVNEAWHRFALANPPMVADKIAEGANYLDVCRRSSFTEPDAETALRGINAVLAGEIPLFEFEYPCHSPAEQRWFLMSVAPIVADDRRGAVVSHLNVTQRKQTEIALKASEDRFRAMFEHAGIGMGQMNADGTWLRVNPRLCEITGFSPEELINRPMSHLVHPEDRDGDKAHLEVLRSGASASTRIEQRLLCKNGSVVWTTTMFGCVRNDNAEVDYFIVSIEDISHQKVVERRQQTLLHELSHRGRNLLGVIQSITRRSLTADKPLTAARDALLGRIHALAKTYDSLTGAAFNGVQLNVVLQDELKSFGGRVHMSGPSLLLTDKATQTMALIIHELATNASKYGALSHPDGILSIDWNVTGPEEARRLRFDWQETGGPPPVAPTRRGFGTTLISEIAGGDFACTPAFEYAAQGFHYGFEAPMERIGTLVVHSEVRNKLKNQVVASLFDTWLQQRPARALPRLAGFDWSHFAATGALTIANIDASGDIHFAQIGRSLVERMSPAAAHQGGWADEDLKTLAATYRRCATLAEPCHELMNIDFGDGSPFVFERLLVPFSAVGGRQTSHIVGIVVIEGLTQEAHTQ